MRLKRKSGWTIRKLLIVINSGHKCSKNGSPSVWIGQEINTQLARGKCRRRVNALSMNPFNKSDLFAFEMLKEFLEYSMETCGRHHLSHHRQIPAAETTSSFIVSGFPPGYRDPSRRICFLSSPGALEGSDTLLDDKALKAFVVLVHPEGDGWG